MFPPKSLDDTHSPTLWHPDLHLDNIFVDPESQQITRIIDWQSAAVMPFFYQCGIARIFWHSWGLPGNGMVEPSQFEEIRAAVEELKESFIAEAREDAEKAVRIWPYQDRDTDD